MNWITTLFCQTGPVMFPRWLSDWSHWTRFFSTRGCSCWGRILSEVSAFGMQRQAGARWRATLPRKCFFTPQYPRGNLLTQGMRRISLNDWINTGWITGTFYSGGNKTKVYKVTDYPGQWKNEISVALSCEDGSGTCTNEYVLNLQFMSRFLGRRVCSFKVIHHPLTSWAQGEAFTV